MLVAAVHKWRLNKIFVAAEADIVIVFQVLAYSKPVWLVPLADFSLSRDKISSKNGVPFEIQSKNGTIPRFIPRFL